ncbi:MAG: cytochrome c oxidase subunit 3, partial [Pannonibacter indicus]
SSVLAPPLSVRNMMVEAARISRGDIQPLADLNVEEFDAVIFPGGFGVAKLLNREAFLAGQAQLSGTAALMETFALILSGWLAAIAVERQRLGRSIRPFLAGATGFGSLFLVLKAGEYAQSLEAFSYEESFAQIYYLLTGFHALHVILGLVLLLVSFARSQAQHLPDFVRYWHFTDIVWLLIFPTVYILR